MLSAATGITRLDRGVELIATVDLASVPGRDQSRALERYQAGAQLAAESFVDVCVTEEELDRIAIRLRLRDDASVHCNFFGRGPSWPLAFLYPIEKRLCDLRGRV